MSSEQKTPRAFISYSWEDDAHRQWVHDLATRLYQDGIDVTLDQWELVPGDQLPAFMEMAVRENHFVLCVCTPKYAEKSNDRHGGVGYEGDIMTAELFVHSNQRKFIPIIRRGDEKTALPSWLLGKYWVDLRGDPYPENQYQRLLGTLKGQKPRRPERAAPSTPPSSSRPASATSSNDEPSQLNSAADESEPIRILQVDVENIGHPKNDGTPGSALYAVRFLLSRAPSATWADLFVQVWNNPPSFSLRHRPRTAYVDGDRIVLSRTTLEEVEEVHLETLKVVVNRVNEIVAEQTAEQRQRQDAADADRRAQEERARDIAKRIRFD